MTREINSQRVASYASDMLVRIVIRKIVTLESFKKLCGYLMFPDGTENEHIVSGLVIGGACLKRIISTGKMRKKLDQASPSSQSATVESDTVEIA